MSPDARHPMALALEWVSKITTVVLEMVLPGLAGWWLDSRLGTRSLLTISGFALGFVAGITHLLVMTRRKGKRSGEHNSGAGGRRNS